MWFIFSSIPAKMKPKQRMLGYKLIHIKEIFYIYNIEIWHLFDIVYCMQLYIYYMQYLYIN